MSPLHSLGIAALAWRSAAVAAPDPRPWVPLVLVAVARMIALSALAYFHLPGIVVLAEPVVRTFAGEAATHYPAHLHALPRLFGGLDLALRMVVVPLATGVAMAQFAARFRGERFGFALALGHRAWLRLIVVGTSAVALQLGYAALLEFGLENFLDRGSRLVPLLRSSMVGLAFLVIAAEMYACAAIVLLRADLADALRSAVQTTARTIVTTLAVVVLPVILTTWWASRLQPDAAGMLRLADPRDVVGVLAVGIGLELITAFLLTGAFTRVFLWKLSPRR